MINLPREVFNLFPTFEYRCPHCGTYVAEPTSICRKCFALFNEAKWRVPPRFLANHQLMSDYAHRVLALKLSREERRLLFKYFTVIFEDHFADDGLALGIWDDEYEGGGGVAARSAVRAHHGAWSLASVVPAAGAAYCFWVKDFAASYSEVGYRCYVYWDSLDAVNNRVSHAIGITYFDVSHYNIALGGIRRLDGIWRWHMEFLSSGTRESYLTDQTIEVATGEWYSIEADVVIGETDGEAEVYINDKRLLWQNGLDNNNYGNPNRIVIGKAYTSYFGTTTSGDAFFDCVTLADTWVGSQRSGIRNIATVGI